MKKTIYACSNCGNDFLKWSGKCEACGAWNSLKEVKNQTVSKKSVEEAEAIDISQVKVEKDERILSGLSEFDAVLGGGIVKGSVNLVGGNPGIGKSTLVWQAALLSGKKVAYIAAEESPMQIKLRSERIRESAEDIFIIPEPEINSSLKAVEKLNPDLVVVDSIQTIFDSDYPSMAGGMLQVKQCALKIVNFAKRSNKAFIIIGHVTKEGEVAGPKTLEHLVDGVFYLEGEKNSKERFFRSAKNRFGAAEGLGVFKMTAKGLESEEKFGYQKLKKDLPEGVSIAGVCEGPRVLFVEVQSLVQKTYFGYPRRNSVGYDLNRLNMIIAILAKSAKIDLSNHDVYLNIAQGYKIKDPSADIAVAASLISSFKNKPLKNKCVFTGELDLAGRVNEVINQELIENSAKKIGLESHLIDKVSDLSNFIKS